MTYSEYFKQQAVKFKYELKEGFITVNEQEVRTVSDLSKVLGISSSTLREWVNSGEWDEKVPLIFINSEKKKPKSRLLAKYDKICPICNGEFYSKSLTRKYCCRKCAIDSAKAQNRLAQAKYRAKQRELSN